MSRRPPPPPEPSLVCGLSLSPPPQIPQCPPRSTRRRSSLASSRRHRCQRSFVSWHRRRRPCLTTACGGSCVWRMDPATASSTSRLAVGHLVHPWICVNLCFLPRLLRPTSPAAPRPPRQRRPLPASLLQDPCCASSSPSSWLRLLSWQSSSLSASRRFRVDPNPVPLCRFSICSVNCFGLHRRCGAEPTEEQLLAS